MIRILIGATLLTTAAVLSFVASGAVAVAVMGDMSTITPQNPPVRPGLLRSPATEVVGVVGGATIVILLSVITRLAQRRQLSWLSLAVVPLSALPGALTGLRVQLEFALVGGANLALGAVNLVYLPFVIGSSCAVLWLIMCVVSVGRSLG